MSLLGRWWKHLCQECEQWSALLWKQQLQYASISLYFIPSINAASFEGWFLFSGFYLFLLLLAFYFKYCLQSISVRNPESLCFNEVCFHFLFPDLRGVKCIWFSIKEVWFYIVSHLKRSRKLSLENVICDYFLGLCTFCQ